MAINRNDASLLSDKPTAQYTSFNSPIERKYVKANFDAVIDDVVLERQLVVTPVEPTPEHKIVVEFAGQWPHNAASLSLSKTDEQYERITKPRADITAGHRSVAIFKDLEPAPRNLYLTIPMQGDPTPFKLLLAKNVPAIEKGTEQAEWDNVLVPVVPMYPKGDQHALYQSGYIYVLWQGEIWREIQISNSGYFCDIDVKHECELPVVTRHVNIDGDIISPDTNVSFERFELYQNGVKVYEGELDICEQARVFSLTEEEVELKFVDVEHEEIILPTYESPLKNKAVKPRHTTAFPMPHIWLPHKILGEPQQDVYLYYSAVLLSESDMAWLEDEHTTVAVPANEMAAYSQQQAFEGEKVYPLPMFDVDNVGAPLVNSQQKSNIAAINIGGVSKPLILRYRAYAETDQSDDFFMLRNIEHEWSQIVYFRQAPADDEGFLNLSFSGWPVEVTEVDILRGASGDRSTTEHVLVSLHSNVKISELMD